jgi:4a-hydroxytetrahydrobiopterin dehydratase
MGTALAARQCVACHGGMPAVAEETIPSLMTELDPGWRVEEGKKLLRTYQVPDFNAAVAFVDAITPVIDAEGHHPILTVEWGKVRVVLWTHAIDALTDNDFILAAKFDQVYQQRQSAA